MAMTTVRDAAAPLVDPASLQKLGVVVPIRFNPVQILPGRHALGQAGEGMRILRSRPYVPRDDNPRDIDKFSPPGQRNVIEWESEAQATMTILADVSASTNAPMLAPLRNLSVLQLTYSLGRAGDRVALGLFDTTIQSEVRAANLAQQLRQSAAALRRDYGNRATDIQKTLAEEARRRSRMPCQLLFVVSDFASQDVLAASEWQRILSGLRCTLVPVIVTYEIPQSVGGAMKLVDAESSSRRLTWLSRRGISRINHDEADRVRSLVTLFRSVGLDCLIVRRQRDVYPGLVELARTRRSRRL